MTQRTDLQNRSLHRWATLMADSMNAAGFQQRAVLNELHQDFEVPWSQEAVKAIFRQVAGIMYPDVESTAELSTTQIQRVYEVVDAKLAEITGIHHEWPSTESMSMCRPRSGNENNRSVSENGGGETAPER